MTKHSQKKKISPPKREQLPENLKRGKKIKKTEKDLARKKQSDDQQELASIWDEDLCE